jgi:hypothetical protein
VQFAVLTENLLPRYALQHGEHGSSQQGLAVSGMWPAGCMHGQGHRMWLSGQVPHRIGEGVDKIVDEDVHLSCLERWDKHGHFFIVDIS